MPPRKKQKTNSGDALAVATTNVVVQTVPCRMTTAATKAIGTTQAAAVVGENASHAASDNPKRIVRKGRLEALPDLPLEIQFEVGAPDYSSWSTIDAQ